MSFGPLCPICQSFSCDCAMTATKGDLLLVVVTMLTILSALFVLAVL